MVKMGPKRVFLCRERVCYASTMKNIKTFYTHRVHKVERECSFSAWLDWRFFYFWQIIPHFPVDETRNVVN